MVGEAQPDSKPESHPEFEEQSGGKESLPTACDRPEQRGVENNKSFKKAQL